MTYHTQGESQHTIFRTLFGISNDVQNPKLAIQWRILIKSALSRDGWLKIASTLARGKAFSWQILQASIPRESKLYLDMPYLGDVTYQLAIISCLFMQDYSSNTVAGNLIYCLLFVTDVNLLEITERKWQEMVTFVLMLWNASPQVL